MYVLYGIVYGTGSLDLFVFFSCFDGAWVWQGIGFFNVFFGKKYIV